MGFSCDVRLVHASALEDAQALQGPRTVVACLLPNWLSGESPRNGWDNSRDGTSEGEERFDGGELIRSFLIT